MKRSIGVPYLVSVFVSCIHPLLLAAISHDSIDQSLGRVRRKLNRIEQSITTYAPESKHPERVVLKDLLRNKITFLATEKQEQKKDLIDQERKQVSELSAPARKLYQHICTAAQGLNRPSAIKGAPSLSFEAETFLAGTIKLIDEYGNSYRGPIKSSVTAPKARTSWFSRETTAPNIPPAPVTPEPSAPVHDEQPAPSMSKQPATPTDPELPEDPVVEPKDDHQEISEPEPVQVDATPEQSPFERSIIDETTLLAPETSS